MAWYATLPTGIKTALKSTSGTNYFQKRLENGKIIHGFCVIDGYNGFEAGDYCQKWILQNILGGKIANVYRLDKLIIEGFRKTQQELRLECFAKWPRVEGGHKSLSGCSATVLLFTEEKVFVGHLGSTAAYVITDGIDFNRLTPMHTLKENDEERKRLEENYAELVDGDWVVWDSKRCLCQPIMDQFRKGKTKKVVQVTKGLGNCWSVVKDTEYELISSKVEINILKRKENMDWFLAVTRNVVDNMSREEILDFLTNSETDEDSDYVASDILQMTEANRKNKEDGTEEEPMAILIIDWSKLNFGVKTEVDIKTEKGRVRRGNVGSVPVWYKRIKLERE